MGDKASKLIQLFDAGFQVPKLICLPAGKLCEQEVHKAVEAHFAAHDFLAVRSSAAVEDGSQQSYAGHFHSEIAVPATDVYGAYMRVCESFNGIAGQVIVQQFIPSSASGVLFTNNGHDLVVINSNFGLSKTVVEGEACDEWYLSRTNTLLRKIIAPNKQPLVFHNNQTVRSNTQAADSLKQLQLKQLVVLGLQVEHFFGAPQDIEWCFADTRLYLLQARPITRQLPKPDFTYFDSANIAESYSGLVQPLTHSFATHIYRTVYKNLLTASGAPRKKVERNNAIFSNMVASYYGRMYYNMSNWYLMMGFLPGYQRNKGNLENMLTTNIRQEVARDVQPSLLLKLAYPFIVLGKLIVFNGTIAKFERQTRNTLRHYRKADLSTYSLTDCWELYHQLNRSLLNKFHIPVENDFLLMTFWGLLQKKHSAQELQERLSFASVSSQQVDAVAELSQQIHKNHLFTDVIERLDTEQFAELLAQNPYINHKIKTYFDTYGGRFANELKLESDDIEHDTRSFLKLMRVYKGVLPVYKEPPSHRGQGFLFRRFFKYARKREELRLLRSNSFSLVRRIFIRMGELLQQAGKLDQAKDVFFCTVDELQLLSTQEQAQAPAFINERKKAYADYANIDVPAFFALSGNEGPHRLNETYESTSTLTGRPCNPGTLTGRVRVFSKFEVPDVIDFDILVARNTDPGWTSLIGLSKGMIIENGGVLSHAAIVSRELGLPTVIGVQGATKRLQTGQMVELNGSTGTITIIAQ